jgi:hypothetical protein
MAGFEHSPSQDSSDGLPQTSATTTNVRSKEMMTHHKLFIKAFDQPAGAETRRAGPEQRLPRHGHGH